MAGMNCATLSACHTVAAAMGGEFPIVSMTTDGVREYNRNYVEFHHGTWFVPLACDYVPGESKVHAFHNGF